MATNSSTRALPELTFDPVFDVGPSIPKVLADPEARRSLSPVSPRVQGGDRHVEVVGERLHGEEPVFVFQGLHDR